MAHSRSSRIRGLGQAEQAVMDYIWSNGPATAESCRDALRVSWPMKDSTMRTVLVRLERKGYLTHSTEGRTYVYKSAEEPVAVATRSVKHLIDRFCGGSAEALVLGMVQNAVLSPKQLEQLAKKIARRKESKS